MFTRCPGSDLGMITSRVCSEACSHSSFIPLRKERLLRSSFCCWFSNWCPQVPNSVLPPSAWVFRDGGLQNESQIFCVNTRTSDLHTYKFVSSLINEAQKDCEKIISNSLIFRKWFILVTVSEGQDITMYTQTHPHTNSLFILWNTDLNVIKNDIRSEYLTWKILYKFNSHWFGLKQTKGCESALILTHHSGV